MRLQLFELDRCIGTGGMGSVYRGRHVETGVDVAVKFIRPDILHSGRRHFDREVQSHAKLLHPGIVYLFEYGTVDDHADIDGIDGLEVGSPFVAMELADRGTLRDWMPLSSWAQARHILVQVLDALAYAHARDVIHRDLKPENFLLFDLPGGDVQVKLADFGLAHAVGSELDTDTEWLESSAGTPYYMPPEQLHGEWRKYGPWTDLYALGCIAWEIVCNEPPFERATPFALAMAHCEEQRPPLRPQFEVPQGLEEWIHRAMATKREERFLRAADALAALPRAESGSPQQQPAAGHHSGKSGFSPALCQATTWAKTLQQFAKFSLPEESTRSSTPIVDGDAPRIPEAWQVEWVEQLPAPLVGTGLGLFSLREPPFVGREQARDRLWRSLRRAIDEEILTLSIVGGEAGVGKTRLGSWLCTRAHEVGAVSVLKAIHTSGGEGPTEGLAGMVRRRFRTWKLSRHEVFECLREELPSLRAEDEMQRISDAQAITELIRPAGDNATAAEGPQFRFNNSRQKYALLLRLFRRWTQRRALLVWLDDVQWGKEALGLVEYLREHADEMPPVYVVATVRSELISEDLSLRKRLDAIAADEIADRFELRPLAGDDHRRMLSRLLPLEPSLRDRVSKRTEGNPLFAVQLLRHWIERGEVEVADQGFEVAIGTDVEVPDDIHTLWMERLKRLVADLADAGHDELWTSLELAATLGREVHEEEWRAVCQQASVPAPVMLVDKLVQRGLAHRSDEDWQFTHGLLVDSLQRRAREQQRWREHNCLCATILAQVYPNRRAETARRRANHFIEAGQLEAALAPLLQDAQNQYRAGDAPERRRVLRRRRDILDQLGVAANDPRRLENEIAYAHLCFYLSETERGEELARRAVEQLEGQAISSLTVRAAQALGMCQRRRGLRDEARLWLEQAIEWARQIDDPGLEVTLFLELAWLEIPAGNLARAHHLLTELIRRTEEMGDDHLRLWGMNYLAWLAFTCGEDRQSADLLERVLSEAGPAGFRSLESGCHLGLGDLARIAGRWDRAHEHYRLSRQLTPRPGGMLDMLGELGLAQVEVARENFDAAGRHLDYIEERLTYLDAGKYRDWVSTVWLAWEAGQGEWEKFDERFRRYANGWPPNARKSRDIPWLLRLAADHGHRAKKTQRADNLDELAAQIERHLCAPGEFSDDQGD